MSSTIDAAPNSTSDPGSLRPAAVPSRAPRSSFDAAAALAFAQRIADEVGPRPGGSPSEAAVRDLFAAALAQAGWTTREEAFPLPQGGTSANVVAWYGHDDPRGGEHVVVGAHLDTVADSPGANDNASGAGVVVALAQVLRSDVPPVPVVLIGFGAEEYQPSQPREHHLGSEAYASAHADRVSAAISVDMVGHGDSTCLCWYRDDTLARALATVAADAGIEDVTVEGRGDISDHGPFARRGVPALFLWTGLEPRYHSPRDTSEHLRVGDLQRAGAIVLAYLRSLG